MPYLLGAVVIVIQLTFIVHVFRTGRPFWWALVIFWFPILGCLVYYFVEVYPGSKQHRTVDKTMTKIAKAVEPHRDLERHAEEAASCESVDNKAALAEECLRAGLSLQAVKLFESCLSGPYAEDPHLRFGLARAYFATQRFDDAKIVLSSLRETQPRFKPHDVALLHARILAAAGDASAALTEYEKLIPIYVGLEAKTRYALLLKSLGHCRQANEVFQDVIHHAQRFQLNHKGEQEWVETARQNIG